MESSRSNTSLPWEENFRRQMHAVREGSNVTQTDLAKRLRDRGLPFHQQTIARIENGDRPIRLDEAYAIAHELHTTLQALTAPLDELREQYVASWNALELAKADLEEAFDRVTRTQRELAAAADALPAADREEIADDVARALAEMPEAQMVRLRHFMEDPPELPEGDLFGLGLQKRWEALREHPEAS